jgi:hypothetical protein
MRPAAPRVAIHHGVRDRMLLQVGHEHFDRASGRHHEADALRAALFEGVEVARLGVADLLRLERETPMREAACDHRVVEVCVQRKGAVRGRRHEGARRRIPEREVQAHVARELLAQDPAIGEQHPEAGSSGVGRRGGNRFRRSPLRRDQGR